MCLVDLCIQLIHVLPAPSPAPESSAKAGKKGKKKQQEMWAGDEDAEADLLNPAPKVRCRPIDH